MTRRLRIPLAIAVRCVLAVALILLLAVPAGARQPTSPSTPSQCAFVGQTLVPSLAMGVRRIDEDDLDLLELRRKPASGRLSHVIQRSKHGRRQKGIAVAAQEPRPRAIASAEIIDD